MTQADVQDGSCDAGTVGSSKTWPEHSTPTGNATATATGVKADSKPCNATA
jgi:hypothetical protein